MIPRLPLRAINVTGRATNSAALRSRSGRHNVADMLTRRSGRSLHRRSSLSYGQRNGKPLAPVTIVPDVQPMPVGVMYQPLLSLAVDPP